MRPFLLTLLLPVLCLGCLETKPGHQFEKALLDIAQSYETYRLVDGNSRWAPVMCEDIGLGLAETPPKAVYAGDFEFSKSDDSQTHGRKLYILFAKRPRAEGVDYIEEGSYVEAGKPNAVGQIVVKEAWAPEEVKDDGKPLSSINRNGKDVVPFARKDGKLYHAKEKSALFIMFKMDPKTPDTDEGWVYGTVTPDGKTVTSAGKVESCMKCHQKAPHERLFGLPADK